MKNQIFKLHFIEIKRMNPENRTPTKDPLIEFIKRDYKWLLGGLTPFILIIFSLWINDWWQSDEKRANIYTTATMSKCPTGNWNVVISFQNLGSNPAKEISGTLYNLTDSPEAPPSSIQPFRSRKEIPYGRGINLHATCMFISSDKGFLVFVGTYEDAKTHEKYPIKHFSRVVSTDVEYRLFNADADDELILEERFKAEYTP